MITEDYVSFETAKLLKEKGFDVYGDGSFNSGIEVVAEYSPSGTFNKCITSKPHQKAYPAPTLQMVMKWLREVHKIFLNINFIQEHFCFTYRIVHNGVEEKFVVYFSTYEEAADAAIKYCLEHKILI